MHSYIKKQINKPFIKKFLRIGVISAALISMSLVLAFAANIAWKTADAFEVRPITLKEYNIKITELERENRTLQINLDAAINILNANRLKIGVHGKIINVNQIELRLVASRVYYMQWNNLEVMRQNGVRIDMNRYCNLVAILGLQGSRKHTTHLAIINCHARNRNNRRRR